MGRVGSKLSATQLTALAQMGARADNVVWTVGAFEVPGADFWAVEHTVCVSFPMPFPFARPAVARMDQAAATAVVLVVQSLFLFWMFDRGGRGHAAIG